MCGCVGPAHGEEAEHQGERQACDDDDDHRQSAIVRQSANQQCAKGRDHHLQEPEQPGSSAGDARADAQSGRQRRRLAQTVTDGADRHRHEHAHGVNSARHQTASITPEASDNVRPTIRRRALPTATDKRATPALPTI